MRSIGPAYLDPVDEIEPPYDGCMECKRQGYADDCSNCDGPRSEEDFKGE